MSSLLYNKEDVGEYKAGSLRRIKLKNFLTYSSVEFSPGPRLNMVVGPNGTGKSSILCAICLALGGEPKLLGRADDARTFIQNDKKEALLEVELTPYENQQTHVLKRTIDREKGSENGRGRGASTYYINDRKVPLSDVKDLVKNTYNISIDNLCTFLPQDKVGNFSQFDDKSLLVETEKTLSGSQHLYQTHMKLIKAELDLRTGVNHVSNIQSKLTKLLQENARLEVEKERFEQRQDALQLANLLEKKIIWLRFEKMRDDVLQLKEQRQEAKVKLKNAHKMLLPYETKIDNIKQQKDTVAKKCKSVEKDVSKCRKEIEKQTKKFETHDDQIDSILLDLREIDSKKNRNIGKFNKAKDRVELLEAELNSFPTEEEVEKQLQDAILERRKASRSYQTAQSKLRQQQSKLKDLKDDASVFSNKLSRLIDEKARRKERIFQQDSNLRKIHQWLESSSNRSIFRREVWGPVACEVSPKSQNAAAFIEQHVPNSALKSFIVEDLDDQRKLYNEVRVKLNIPINIIVVKDGKLVQLDERIYSDNKFSILRQQHGVIGYLDESFTAPDPILQALRSTAAIHKVLVGGEDSKHSIDHSGLLNYLGEPDPELNQKGYQPSCIFCSESSRSMKYTIMVSRYGGKKPTTREDDNIRPAKWLAQGTNPRQKLELEEKLKEIHEHISLHRPALEDATREHTECENFSQECHARQKSARDARSELVKFHTKLDTARRKMKEAGDAIKDSEINDEKEKKGLISSLMKRVVLSINAIEQQSDCQNQLMQSTYSSAGIRVNRDVFIFAERTWQREYTEKKQEFDEINIEAQRINGEYVSARNQLKDIKAKAESIAKLLDDDGNELPIKSQLEELPVDTLEDAEAALEEAMIKINNIVENLQIMQIYEERKAEIEQVEKELKHLEGSKDTKSLEIEQMKRPWEQALEKSITGVNKLFSKYMAELDYTGEVTLKKGVKQVDKNDDTSNKFCMDNFKDWGIEIRVSFRKDSKTQILTAHVQSGGERSVSTIMYLMALQEMMVSPFRCVDEINQGLDERNERFVFRRIVQNSTRAPCNHLCNHSGQYFLITPKLLPNLYDMEAEAMTVLFIFNGAYNFQSPSDWNVDHLVKLRKKRAMPCDDEHDGEKSYEQRNETDPTSSRKKRRNLTSSRKR